MFQAIAKLTQLLKNVLFLREPAVHYTMFELMGGKRFFQLLLNFLVPYGYFGRYFLLKVCKDKSKHIVPMLESGFFHAAMRVISPEERLAINTTYCTQKYHADFNSRILPEGFKKLGQMVSKTDCESVVAYLKNEQGYLGHLPLQSDGTLHSFDEAQNLAASRGRYFSYAPSTSLKNPIINSIIQNPLVKQLVHQHVGSDDHVNDLINISTFVVFPGSQNDHYVMKFHRDYDDFNSLTFFIYWSDVGADNGATIYVPNSHIRTGCSLEQKVFLSGNAGEAFALDGFGLHAGNSNVKTTRFVTWYRYGLKNNLLEAQGGWPCYKVRDLMRKDAAAEAIPVKEKKYG